MTPKALADLDDPWLEKAVAAELARRPKDRVRDHLEALHTSSELTRWFRKDREPEVLNVTPENVIAALNRAGIRPVLMGTYGIGGYRSEPRATQDVDVLVTRREVRKAVRVLEEEFPYLEIVENVVVARFRNAATQMALVSKFVAIVSPTRRQAKKLIDLGDFVDVIEHNRANLDLEKLKRLANNIHRGAGARILRMVEDIDAGRMIQLE